MMTTIATWNRASLAWRLKRSRVRKDAAELPNGAQGMDNSSKASSTVQVVLEDRGRAHL